MLQSILKLTLFNDDEEVRPKNHPKKEIPDARRKNRDGGKTIGAADGEQPRLQIENNRNLLKLSVSEANLETQKGKRNTHTHTREQLQKRFEKKQSMRSSLTCTRRLRFRASETRSRNCWSNVAERKKARPSPDPANESSATSSKDIHVLKEMTSQETRSRIFFFFFRLGSQMFRTWNNEFTPLGC